MPEPPVLIQSLDGAGQALRAAVALSVATGRGFVVERVVSGRVHPGSHSQNLTVVQAAAEVCGARVYGNDLHSSTLVFEPGAVVAGDYTFGVGGASSAALLMQAIYLPLVLAGAPSTLIVNGGTHVPFSPPFPYLEDAWLPMLQAMEIEVDLALVKPGFFPRGGGTLRLATDGTGIQGTIRLGKMGELDGVTIRSITGNLPFHVGERQLDHAIDYLKQQRIAAVGGTETLISEAPGTVLQLVGYFSSGQRLVCSALGKKGESAEEVAEIACREFLDLLDTECNVDAHLADQLLIPLALASQDGEYVAPMMTADLEESADIVNAFLPDRIELEPLESGAVRVRNRR